MMIRTWNSGVRFLLSFYVLLAVSVVQAQTPQTPAWPTRPVVIVVPFPAGGGTDTLARVVAEKLFVRIGQPVLVDNKPGGAGLVGAGFVARSAADGHTLLLSANTVVISPLVLPKGAVGGIDIQRDLAPVGVLGVTPMVFLANSQLGVTNLQQLLTLARKEKNLAYASSGNGSPMHFAGEMLKQAAQVDLLHVPYQGISPSIAAALGGEVNLLFSGLGAAMPHIRSGKLVALAVMEKARTPLMAQVPTASEQGVPGVEVNAWFGVFAPMATPPAMINRLNQHLDEIMALPEVRDKLLNTGIEARGGSARQLGAWVKEDTERYAHIVRQLSIKAD